MRRGRLANEQGMALVAVMTVSTLLLALGVSLAMTTTVEVGIAANHRDAVQTLHAADAALEFAIAELGAVRRLGCGARRRHHLLVPRRRRWHRAARRLEARRAGRNRVCCAAA